jgi:ubiquinone/menaquinone biosynthesis C-methylase UbiE
MNKIGKIQKNRIETPDIETSSNSYANRFSGDVGEWFLEIQERITLNMISNWPNASVIDVGGGHGQITPGLVENGYRVHVFSSDDQCKMRISSFIEDGEVEFSAGNLLSLPFPDRHFDIAISYRLLPHLDQWDKLITEMTRIARHAVLVDFPTSRSLNFISPLLFQLKKQIEKNTRTYILFKESDILDVFKRNHYSEFERSPEFFLPMVLHRYLGSRRFSHISESFFHFLGLTRFFGSPIILKSIRKRG